MNARRLLALVPLLAATVASGQTLAPPYAGTYTAFDLGSIAGLPPSYGGLVFKAGDPNTILIGGQANDPAGRFHEVPVVRGAGGHIASFGTPVAKGFGANNDGGVAYGPSGVLFFAKYNVNQVGQVRPGSNAEDKTVNLGSAPLNIAVSPGALTFVPPGIGGAGRLKICSYSGGQFYDVSIGPDGSGTYNLLSATQVATLPGAPEGFIYAPAGSPLFTQATLLVTEYGAGKIAAYDADGNGNPLVASRRDFLTGLTGGEGATIDPVTGDFLFSTFGSTNRVIQVRGFNPPPPPATVTLTSSANPSFVGDSVTFTAAIAGVAPIGGTVTFKNNGVDIPGCVDVAVAANEATCATAALAIGRYPIVAFYSGNATNGAANSATLTQRVLAQPPGGVGIGNRIWLDASDPTTLFGDAACTQPVTVSGHDVACWLDKSGFSSDVKDVGTANGEPTFLTGQFNGKAALEFRKSESDTLRRVLGTPWTGDYTEFVVFQQVGTPVDYDSFFSNGDSSSGPYHQITQLGGSFKWFHGSTQLTIEPWTNELKLYAVRGNGSGTEVFADGASKGSAVETGGRTFAQYRINQNRSGDRLNNSKIAEVIVYDRALTNCEVEQVSLYLGTKYGRDFLDITADWDGPAPFVNDVNGIASVSTAFCGTPRVIDSAQSSWVTIDQPADLESPEILLIGHNAGTGTNVADVPAGFDVRLNRLWYVDGDQAGDGMTVRVTFDLSALGGTVDTSNPALFALLIGSNPNNMAAATQVLNPTIEGNLLHFTGVNLLPDGRYFTLAHHVPPGIFVHNTGPQGYPALGSPIVVAPNLEIFFANPAQPIDTAKVDISASYQSGADALGIQGQSGTSGAVGSLSWAWDAATGVLTLSGAGTPATYQAALRQVTFRNTSGTPSTAQRKLTYSLGNGLQFPGTGHFYEFVPSPGILQAAANTAASARSYFGIQGYLTTVTSQGETDFIIAKLGGKGGWIGASDAAVADTWRWITGPEGLEDGGSGRIFYQGAAPSGTAVGGAFVNWNSGEPNRSGDVAYFIKVGSSWGGTVGRWDDIPDNAGSATGNIDGYVVEYGGLPGDSSPHLADDAFVNILVPTLTLTKAKTSPAGNPDVATNVVYTLTYQNTGAADALNVVLHDAVPAGATFVSATGGGTLSGSTVTWNLGTVVAGAPAASVTVTIQAPAAAGTMTNSANISATNAAQVQATASVTVVGPTLTLQKSGPVGVAVGTTVTYTLQYANSGSGSAAAPVLVDTFPAGTTFASAVPPPTSTTATTATWNLAAIAPAGSGSVSLTLNAPATAGSITNAATLAAAGATTVQATATTRVTTCANSATPCLTKGFLPGAIEAGGPTSTLTLALENGTDGVGRTVSFTDTLPAGLELAAAPTSSCVGGSVTGSVGGTTIAAAALGLGGANPQSCAVTATVRGTTAGARVNDASRFSATGGSVDVSGASATLVVTKAVLGLTKTAAPASVVVGNTVTYTLAYTNTGTATATSVQLVDPIPAGATWVGSTGGGVFAAGSVTWTLGSLAPGATSSVTVTVRAPGAPATLSNTATLSAANATSVQASATVSVFGEPKFQLAVTDAPDPVLADEDLHYVLTITNTGTLAATGTTLSLPLPAGTSFVSATGGGTFGGGAITWNLGTLPVGSPASVTATVRVGAGVPNGSTLTATATANAANLAPPAVTAQAQTAVVSEPLLVVSVTDSPDPVQGGGGIAYLVEFANLGTATAAGSTVSLTAPGSTTIQTASAGGAVAGQTVTWPLGNLLPGQTGSVAVTVAVDTGVPDGTVLTAAATIGSTTSCGTPPAACGDFVDTSTTVAAAAVLELTKSAPASVAAGGTITYELTFDNAGNLAAEDVVLADRLPDHTSFVSATGGGRCEDGQTPPGPCTGLNDGTFRVIWDLGALGVGQGGTAFVTVAVESPLADGTALVNTASLESTAPGGPQPASAQATTHVRSSAAFILTKSAPLQIGAGDLMLYRLDYRNSGTDTGTGVVLTDQLPADTTFVSASGGGTHSGGVVTWTPGSVPAGGGGSVTVVVAVASPLPNGTLLANNATLRSTEAPPISAQAVTRVLSAPLPRLEKSSTPADVVAAGAWVTYTLTFGNDGNEDLLNAVLTDHLPAGLDPAGLVIGGGGTWDPGTGTITWDLGAVPAGTSGSQTFSARVRVDTPTGTLLANSATLAGDDAPPVTVVQPLLVTSAPVLTLTKQGPAVAAAGATITYTLTYANTGNATATNAVLADLLPAGTTFVSASGGGSESSGLVSWSLGDVPPGGGASVVLVASVNEPLPDGTALENVALLGAANAASTGDSMTTRVTSAPVLELAKRGPGAVVAGGQIVYQLEYRNTGNDTAWGVVLADFLPAGTTFASATGGGTPSGNVVIWNLGNLVPGAGATVTVTVNVASPLPRGTLLHNQASLGAPAFPAVTAETTTVVVSAPILSVTKTASPSPFVAPGGQILYTIQIRNDGNEDSLNTELLDLLPPGTTYVVAVPPPAVQSPTIVSWNVGTLAAGASATYSLTVQLAGAEPNGTLVLNSVSLYGDDALTATSQALTQVFAAPALRHLKTTWPTTVTTATPGGQVTYALEYQNVGRAPATGATLVDLVPPFTSFVSATGGGVWNATNRTVTWDLGNLAAGSGGSVFVTLRVDTASPPPDGTVLANLSSFDTNETAPAFGTASVTVLAPVLRLTKTATPEPVSAGGALTYQLTFENLGSAPATGLVLTDLLDPNLTFSGQTGGGVYNPGTRTVTWLLPPLAPGASGSVTLFTTVASPLPNGTPILNQATIDANEADPLPVLVQSTVLSAPALTLTKTASPDPVSPGGVVTYTLTVLNSGNDDATRVLVVDRLPADLQFLSASGGGVADPGLNTVTWDLGTIPAGSGPTLLTLEARVISGPGTVTNTAEISSFESPVLAVSHDLTVDQLAQVPTLSGLTLAALALAVALAGARVLRGSTP